mgnify:CR=1 FL=1
MASQLHLYNTLTRSKEVFEALAPPRVGMYVCGPTVYNYVHLGNCRTFISFDLVYRYLTHLGYKVRYVRNITDAGHLENDADVGEDKISKKARLEEVEPMEIVQRYATNFREVMALFNAFPPSIEPTATGHIVEQIQMVKTILEADLAYEVNGSVYFDVAKYSETNHYGKLSGRVLDDLISSDQRDDESRELDGQGEKRNSADFALWKKASPTHIMRWDSPWGIGFPGWHLECSVMSTKYLGEQFDIHGGGMDLQFPHHECEVAQNVASSGVDPVRYWMHGNMLTMNGTRMAKSKGNFVLPLDLFSGNNALLSKGFSPMVVRFFMMQAHYRSTLDFSNEALLSAEKGFHRLMESQATLEKLNPSKESTFDVADLKEKCYAALNDDLNTPVMIAHLFDGVKFINSVKDGKASITSGDLAQLKQLYQGMLMDVLGLKVEAAAEADDDLVEGLMSTILDLRQQAKSNKDWTTADKIRDSLNALNIVVKDGKEGAEWERKS